MGSKLFNTFKYITWIVHLESSSLPVKFLGMCSLARRKKLHLTASLVMKTVNIVTLRLPQVWITGLKIYSKRDSLLTMDVAAISLKVLNCCLFCPSPHCHLSINWVLFQSLLYFPKYGPKRQQLWTRQSKGGLYPRCCFFKEHFIVLSTWLISWTWPKSCVTLTDKVHSYNTLPTQSRGIKKWLRGR